MISLQPSDIRDPCRSRDAGAGIRGLKRRGIYHLLERERIATVDRRPIAPRSSKSVLGVELGHRRTHVRGAGKRGIARKSVQGRIGPTTKPNANRGHGVADVAMKTSPCGVRNATRWRTAARSVESGKGKSTTRSVRGDGRKKGRGLRQQASRVQPVTPREKVASHQLKRPTRLHQQMVEMHQKEVIGWLGIHLRRREPHAMSKNSRTT